AGPRPLGAACAVTCFRARWLRFCARQAYLFGEVGMSPHIFSIAGTVVAWASANPPATLARTRHSAVYKATAVRRCTGGYLRGLVHVGSPQQTGIYRRASTDVSGLKGNPTQRGYPNAQRPPAPGRRALRRAAVGYTS